MPGARGCPCAGCGWSVVAWVVPFQSGARCVPCPAAVCVYRRSINAGYLSPRTCLVWRKSSSPPVLALVADPAAELLSALVHEDRHEGRELCPVQAQECEPVLRLFACQDFGHAVGVLLQSPQVGGLVDHLQAGISRVNHLVLPQKWLRSEDRKANHSLALIRCDDDALAVLPGGR